MIFFSLTRNTATLLTDWSESLAKTKTTPGPKPKYGPREEIHVQVPVDDLHYIRSKGNVTEWVIQAIKEKREREGKMNHE